VTKRIIIIITGGGDKNKELLVPFSHWENVHVASP
jgi:hypothetical protein